MDWVRDFFHSRWFKARHKTRLHILQITMVILIIVLTAVRTATKPKGMPTTRSDTIAITMSVKTFVILAYQLVTEHIARFKKWGSLNAYAILNTLEILFWFVVIIITLMDVRSYCKGANCAMSFFVALVAMLLTTLAFWTSVVSWLNFRHFKNCGVHRGQTLPQQHQNTQYPVHDDEFITK